MKVILVVDIPLSINCEDLESYEAELKIIDKYEDEYVLSKHHLSLKPIPQNKTPSGSDIFNDYVRGYNACIDEILGGKE